MKWVVVLLCVVRIAGNSLWPFFDSPTMYYVTQGIFEAGILLVLYLNTEGWLRSFLSFCFGMAVFALLKELWNPCEFEMSEYYGFGFATLILAAQMIWQWKKSKN